MKLDIIIKYENVELKVGTNIVSNPMVKRSTYVPTFNKGDYISFEGVTYEVTKVTHVLGTPDIHDKVHQSKIIYDVVLSK